MTFKRTEFRDRFIAEGNAPTSANAYCTNLGLIDKALELGLDETIARDGIEKVLAWAQNRTDAPFDTYPSNKRSALRRYGKFLIDETAPTELASPQLNDDAAEVSGLAFRLEKEMQAGVRRQLANIEPGLVEADGGTERSTPVGRIDIVAKDSKGDLVVIELKAGLCPPGAMEQALGYAQAISEEEGRRVRALLIASEFSDRTLAAAKRVPGLELRTYEFSLTFKPVA